VILGLATLSVNFFEEVSVLAEREIHDEDEPDE
jgi:hypothetical protein